MSKFTKKVAERIRQVRKNYGISQQGMANLIGATRSSYSGYENGYADIPHEVLVRFCEITAVSTDYILTGKEDVNCSQTNVRLVKELLKYKNFINKMKIDIKKL
jgi:transcriptional regulator with XRE-family HTH domain